MVRSIRRFTSSDLDAFEIQRDQMVEFAAMVDEFGVPDVGIALETFTRGYVVERSGCPIAILGLRPYWNGRWAAWAWIGADVDRYDMLYIHRETVGYLDEIQKRPTDIRRIEMTARADFHNAVRWAFMLGFKHEATMPKYGPDGSSYHLFSRVVT